jgi:hypothetical protein
MFVTEYLRFLVDLWTQKNQWKTTLLIASRSPSVLARRSIDSLCAFVSWRRCCVANVHTRAGDQNCKRGSVFGAEGARQERLNGFVDVRRA